MGPLLSLRGGAPSKLSAASAGTVPGNGADRLSGGGGFPAGCERPAASQLAAARPLSEGEISEHGLRTATGRLEAQLDRLLEKSYRDPANRRLAKHLEHERPFLFTFLYCPRLDATKLEAARAVRWRVIARKVWRGNRTWAGAQTQQ